MRDDQHRFLMLLGQLPARLTAEQAAWVLNCGTHDIPALVAAKLVKPLGNPPQNGPSSSPRRNCWKPAKTATGWCACRQPFTSIGRRRTPSIVSPSNHCPFRRKERRASAIRPARAGNGFQRTMPFGGGVWGRRKSPKQKRAVEPAKTQPPFYFQAATAGGTVAAFLS
jgi:hypothetical protein